MSHRSNQLTSVVNYDVSKMVFSDAEERKIPNSPLAYRRVGISTLNQDGTYGDLIFQTERVFSFGVSENTNPGTSDVNGYNLALCLWSKTGATEGEKTWTDTFNRVVEHCKKHLLENKEEIGQYELTEHDLKKFNPLYWKKDKGQIVEGTGPTLYAKLITSKKNGEIKILSMFSNVDGTPVDAFSLKKRYCFVNAAIKIESIFIGNKISLQVKVYEAVVEPIDGGMKPLLANKIQMVLPSSKTNVNPLLTEDFEDMKASIAEIKDSEDEEEEAPKPVMKKKVVKKVVRK